MNFITLIFGSISLLFSSARYGLLSIPLENSSNPLLNALKYLNPFYFKFYNLREGQRLVALIESQGPVFIKFGQLLSTRTDILDVAVAKDLQILTDQCKNFDSQIAKKLIEKELGDNLNHLFDDLSLIHI